MTQRHTSLASLAMGDYATEHLEGQRFTTWQEFSEHLSPRFLSSYYKFKFTLLSELSQQKMQGNGYAKYYLQFKAYLQHVTDVDRSRRCIHSLKAWNHT